MASDIGNKSKTAVLSAADSVTEYTHIPLRDPNKADDHLEEFKENLLKKAQSFSDDTDQLADDLIKDTADIVNEGTAVTIKHVSDAAKTISLEHQLLDKLDDKTSTHSLDSLRTSSPDPEIEKALSNVDKRKHISSPEPTLNELSEMMLESANKSIDKEMATEVQ